MNSMLAVEHMVIANYQHVLDNRVLNKRNLEIAVTFQTHHKQHRDWLMQAILKISGSPGAPRDKYNFDAVKTEYEGLTELDAMESLSTSSYSGNIPLLNSKVLVTAGVQIMAAEAWHMAVMKSLTGKDPAPSAFLQ